MNLSQNPLISVVVTTHKRPHMLRRALNSLLAQKFSNFEIILCADETSVETKSVATELLRKTDSFVSAAHLKGPAQTRNIGMQLAVGNWVCFLDDDDTFCENYFSEVSRFLDLTNEIKYFNFTKLIEDRTNAEPILRAKQDIDISETSSDILYVHNYIPVNALMIPNCVAKLHSFDTHLESIEDWEWLLSLKIAGYQFKGHQGIYGPNVFVDPNESSRNKSKSAPLDVLSVFRKWPTSNESLRNARANFLAKQNINVPKDFL